MADKNIRLKTAEGDTLYPATKITNLVDASGESVSVATLDSNSKVPVSNLPAMTGATGAAAGTAGAVPAPSSTDNTKFLRGDGTWAEAGGGGTLPEQTGQSGKFLTTDGTDASWSDKPLVNNTTKGLSILGTSSNSYSSTSIGKYASALGLGSVAISDSYGSTTASGTYATCVGGDSSATGTAATAFGSHAKATANYATQIGYGTNSESNSVYASTSASNNWKLLGSDGTIPATRLADTTNAAQGQVLTLDSNLNAEWTAVPTGGSLPDQTGQSGKFLTTDGTDASWAAVSSGSTYSAGTGLNLSNDTFSLKAATDSEIGGVKISYNATSKTLTISTN